MVDSFFKSFFLLGLGLIVEVCFTSFLLKFFIAEPGGDPLPGEILLGVALID